MSDERYVASKVYDRIKTDPRVNKDLNHCLYCMVVDSASRDEIRYDIPLDSCASGFKQCPACKRIYILSEPI